MAKSKPKSALKGWKQIADFLGQPIHVAHRWAKSGLPVSKQGRSVTASVEKLNQWLARESGGEPVHVATQATDLESDLRRGLSYVRQHGQPENLKRTRGKRS